MEMEENYDKQSGEFENRVKKLSQICTNSLGEVSKRIVGQTHIARRLFTALIAQGHVLLEGLPGLAKTTSIKTLGEVAGLSFGRIQFTPDLLPADLIGTQVYDPKSVDFKVKKGPIFTHLLLADEINRAPAKVQSALLEAMEEKQVTIGGESYKLAEPFLVMATQNPVEQEGTYSLPEAQIDRFLFKLKIDYGSAQEELEIINRAATGSSVDVVKSISKDQLIELRSLIDQVYISDKIRKYIVQVVFATRKKGQVNLKGVEEFIEYGASPRASICLDRAARAHALLEGRTYVVPQDIKDISYDVLRHRLKLTYEAEAENIVSDDIIERILQRVDVP